MLIANSRTANAVKLFIQSSSTAPENNQARLAPTPNPEQGSGGEANGFNSIPTAMYWAIVTVTTVGYGDISPKTVGGRILASILMIIGYEIIAVPNGIVTFEFARAASPRSSRVCSTRSLSPHDPDATFCKRCGSQL